jgi:hypothetical protein
VWEWAGLDAPLNNQELAVLDAALGVKAGG